MNDLAGLERRIMAALQQMERGLEQLARPAPPADPGPNEVALAEALAAERRITAQLKDGVRAIREKQDTAVASLEQRLTQAAAQLEEKSQEVARLTQGQAEMQETIRVLTEAAKIRPPAPDAREQTLMQELEALRLARAADLAEMDEILAALEPLMPEHTKAREAAHA